MTTTLPARPFTSSASPTTARPVAPTSRPVGSINKHPDLRPITATVPVTRRPHRPPQAGPEPHVCEAKLVRGVQWPTTQRGETVDRPCPKGSLGEDMVYCMHVCDVCVFECFMWKHTHTHTQIILLVFCLCQQYIYTCACAPVTNMFVFSRMFFFPLLSTPVPASVPPAGTVPEDSQMKACPPQMKGSSPAENRAD